MQIVGVGMLDVDAIGSDRFWVQVGDDQVIMYEASDDGTVEAVTEVMPLIAVTASIEKFNTMYALEEPVSIERPEQLWDYLGRFEISTDTTARFFDPQAWLAEKEA